MSESLKIAINAQLSFIGKSGGIEQFLIALIKNLGQLSDGPENYIIHSSFMGARRLKHYLGQNQTLYPNLNSANLTINWLLKKLIAYFTQYGKSFSSKLNLSMKYNLYSQYFYDSLNIDMIHFPYQYFIKTNLPTVFNPHDLLHLHHPDFFKKEELHRRNVIYSHGCFHANAIVTHSQYVKEDIIKNYQVDPDKVFVIHHAAPTDIYEALDVENLRYVRQKFSLPKTFMFYPAQTWRHKNHIRLLKSIKFLRDQHGFFVNLVCTGSKNEFWPTIKKCIKEFNLENQVFFLGFITPKELRAVYYLSQFVIFPSLFEGAGMPVLEAFRERKPVACSSVTSLPSYAGDSAILFDPTNIEEIAGAIRRMTVDNSLRDSLRRRGAIRIKQFSWERISKVYRALYRKVLNYPLTDEDHFLLENSSSS